MRLDPNNLDYEKASALLPASGGISSTATKDSKEINELLHGDLWRNSLGYDGPQPQPGEGYIAGLALLRRAFVPIPKIQECLRRHVRGVVGQEPLFEMVPRTINEKGVKLRRGRKRDRGLDQIADAVDTAQGDWWDAAGYFTMMQEFVGQLRGYGRACLRYDIPPGVLVEGNERQTGQPATKGVNAKSFEEALGKIYVEVVSPGAAGVYEDRSTGLKVGVYRYQEESDTRTDISTRRGAKVNCVQLSWVQENNKTAIRIVRDDSTEPEQCEVETGGKLLVLEAQLSSLLSIPFLSKALRDLQERLCGVATMIKVNANVAGFPEGVAIDLQQPTEPVPDPAHPGETKEKPVPLARGPRTMPFLFSTRDEQAGRDGEALLRKGTLIWREPVSSEPLRDDARFFEELIYAACQQRHLVKSIAADASGAALIEWRADYADSLLETRAFVERIFRDLFKGTACLAAGLANDGEKLKACQEARWRVDCRLNAGPLTPDERREIMERAKGRFLSYETAMVLLGIEDIVSELAKIEEEKATAVVPPAQPQEPPQE